MNILRTLFTISLLLLVLVTFSGCAVIQQQLEPMVCNCETTGGCEGPELQIASAIAMHEVERAQDRAEEDGELAAADLGYPREGGDEAELARSSSDAEPTSDSDGDAEAQSRAEALAQAEEEARRHRREMALDPIDASVPDAHVSLGSEQDRELFEATFGISPPEQLASVFQGPFTLDEEPTVAIHQPGESLSLYQEGRLLAARDFSQYEVDEDIEAVDEAPATVVDVVQSGTIEVKLIHARPEDEGTTYFVGIYKLIGEEVGVIFHHPIAHRDAEGILTRFADIEFLHGKDHRTIQWIPLDEDGQPAGEPLLYEWNHWEGVYRVPSPPPTAPDRSAPQSSLDTPRTRT